jgi:hypothetical protein
LLSQFSSKPVCAIEHADRYGAKHYHKTNC